VGTVTASPDTGLHAITSADGASIYALTPSGEITRFTPSGAEWKFRPSLPASALFAQADGSLGYFQHAFRVYDQEGQACPTQGCNGRIERQVQAGRSSFFCAACQT
jgi:hypothetical protein